MTSNELLNKYEKELIDLEISRDRNAKACMYNMAFAREKQIELVRRFVKDLKKLLV